MEQLKGNIPKAQVAFQEAWRVELGGLKLAQTTIGRHGGVCLGKGGTATFLDHRGKPLWTAELGGDIRSLSLAETQEVLAVQESGSALLVDPTGQTLWRKRVMPALTGAISGSGQFLGFVTRDPTVVLADRASRPKWTYRNLLKVPPAIAITHDGDLIAFASQDERGEGIVVVGSNGKPATAFYGLDPIIEIFLSRYGHQLLAIDKIGTVLCFNVQNSSGVWKTLLSPDFIGLSYAEEARQTLVFSRGGGLALLDDAGCPIWETQIPGTPLTAGISADGKSIWLATAQGTVMGLESQALRDTTHKGFADVPPPTTSASENRVFHRLWQIELPRPEPGDAPQCQIWTGPDQVEYALLWDGQGCLVCLNDLGEEVWNIRLPGGPLRAMAISAEADLGILASGNGVLGLRLDGIEEFRLIGIFRVAHVFKSGSFLFLDDSGKVSFFPNAHHQAHPIELPEPVRSMAGCSGQAALIGTQTVFLVSADGQLIQSIPGAGPGAFFGLLPAPPGWILGTPAGVLSFFNWAGEEIYRYVHASQPPGWVVFSPEEDVVFLANPEESDVVVLQNRLQNRTTIGLSGKTRVAVSHAEGVVIGSSVDEVILMACTGEILGKYPFPDRLLQLFSGQGGENFYILSEGSFGKFTFRPGVVNGRALLPDTQL